MTASNSRRRQGAGSPSGDAAPCFADGAGPGIGPDDWSDDLPERRPGTRRGKGNRRAGPAAEQDVDADPAAVARAIVLRQLTNSPKSRLQLARKLTERNVPGDVAEAVLDRFEEVKLVDDAEFADLWVRSRSQSRKLAKGALRRELAEKGIDTEIAAVALEQVSDEDEASAARELVQRKLRGVSGFEDRAQRDKTTRRLASMLARKGYQPAQAFRIVGEILDEAVAGPGAGPEPEF
ncbi:regulatory protein [Arthrobacter sp. MP_M7]|nr:regulatory protein [Arthrobacter sp. MP_M4]MEC5201936.1 regulatory protein [Arthrobacter sp. MP_M7]